MLAASPYSPRIGIVTYITEAEIGLGDPDVFVAAATGPDMEVMGLHTDASVVGSGAGLSWDEARGAALGECLERYCSAFVREESLTYGSYDDLVRCGLSAHEPGDWALFDPGQRVPYPAFTNDQRLAWVSGEDIASRTRVMVPACFAQLSSSPLLNVGATRSVGPSVSTGCACADAPGTAQLRGLCELIERDAFMIVWRNALSVPRVEIDPASQLNEVFQSRFARPGIEYMLWHTTLDLGVPSFFGLLLDKRGPRPRMVVGGAANPDAARAALKTLCELIQGLSWLDHTGFADEEPVSDFAEIRTFMDRARLYSSAHLMEAFSFLLDTRDRVSLSSLESEGQSSAVELDRLVGKLIGLGYRPVVVDLTTPDVAACGYHVNRVVVPGLETMDGDHRLQMLGGPRWRTVPRQVGFDRPAVVTEPCNPFPHPYP